ncbi:DUF4350 domain-containing protein [Rufibacter roseus]|uniref:DUF4350 domain-containing protein n=1 Tax=Rufibacter roseus TaxID=1567108 RepID=A0ABW2DJ46_9BACT|nr:DUF4350 domain-containing protein [Rufibacter roseus]
MSGYRKYAVMLALLFAAFVLVEYYRPKPVDWTQSLSNKDKIPYGTYVLYQLLPDLFKGESVSQVRLPIVNQLEENLLEVEEEEEEYVYEEANYVFIDQAFEADSLDMNTLLDFVHQGNNVFIGAHYFEDYLKDTLNFSTGHTPKTEKDSLELVFLHPQLKKKVAYKFDWEKANITIKPDSVSDLEVLGKNAEGGVNFVRAPLGKGNIYVSTVPLAFSNYYVINSNKAQYAATALSHLPVRQVWWDEYQNQGPLGENSIFRVILANDALSWAYYISLCGLLLFVVFESKRTQRIIPVQEKPRNTTLEFVQVVGNLYYNYRDHQVIAQKKINYFLEYLRLRYYESTNVLDHEFQERVSKKSGVESKEVGELFNLIHYIRNTDSIEEHTLWNLNKKLEDFYRLAS